MDRKTLGYVVAAAVVAAGVYAAFTWGDFGYEDCNGQKCDVTLEVNATCTDKKAKPHKIKVKTKGADIFFAAPSGFEFCGSDQPAFKDSADQIYASQFINRCKTASTAGTPFSCLSTQPACAPFYHWTSVGDIVKKFEYEVTITNTQTQQKCKIDPWIKNG